LSAVALAKADGIRHLLMPIFGHKDARKSLFLDFSYFLAYLTFIFVSNLTILTISYIHYSKFLSHCQ